MELRQFALIAAAVFLGFLIYQKWQEDYPAVIPNTATVVDSAASEANNTGENGQRNSDLPAPPAGSGEDRRDLPEPANVAVDDTDRPSRSGTTTAYVTITTDTLRLRINRLGGSIDELQLLQYPIDKSTPDQSVTLLTQLPQFYFSAQDWLLVKPVTAAAGVSAGSLYTDEIKFEVDQANYSFADKKGTVRLQWENEQYRISKIFTFSPASYEIAVDFEIENRSSGQISVAQYSRLKRGPVSLVPTPNFIATHFGGAWYEEQKSGKYAFEKLDFDDDFVKSPLSVNQTGGWVAMIQHHFLAASLPGKQPVTLFTKGDEGKQRYDIGWVASSKTVEPSEQIQLQSKLFIGPKLQDQMQQTSAGLELSVDYGIFTFFAKYLFWLMKWFHSITGNWGIAIILLTLTVKIVFYKPSEWQYRSMAKMRKFAPKIKTLRDRYGDDKEKLNQAMMDLYKKEKFNPMGGCLPLLIQMPVFIALYWVLIESVEFRQQPFMLWLNDLTAPDPYYILPILFGLSMFVQQRLMSSTSMMDPMQERIMMFMPIGLTIFFAFFPSGLVLYWVVNNLLGMLQQWWIMRQVDNEDAKLKTAKSK